MKYDVILADPPWDYARKTGQAVAIKQYATMSLDAIKKIPVGEIAAENAVLFLWVTAPLLREQFEVFDAWQFQYKTIGFSWFKTNPSNGAPFFGVGYYTKSNCELCLFGTHGEIEKPATDEISQVIVHPRAEHSKKPQPVRDRIKALYPNARRIELFAREADDGWDCAGNGVSGLDINDEIRSIAAMEDRSGTLYSPRPVRSTLFDLVEIVHP